MFEFSDKEIERFIDGIYDGSITEYELPEGLYQAIAKYFERGLYKGFGMELADAAGADLELLTSLRENIHMFSAAKTFQQVKDIGAQLFDEDGKQRSNREFNQIGFDLFEKWNLEWGKTEYITTVGQARSAVKWNEIEANKKALPILRYSAVMDANTSDECAAMDGVTAPVEDPIWYGNSPLQHFRCRCLLTQHEEGEHELTSQADKDNALAVVYEAKNPLFDMNPGRDGYIWSQEHPYFQVEAKDKEFAQNNFGLPMPTINKNEDEE